MRREKLEYLVTFGIIERNRSWGKQTEKILEGLTKWLNVGRDRCTESGEG